MALPAVDEGKLNQAIGQILNDLGGAASVAMVRMGDALGLYKTLQEKGSMTCEELASAAGVHQRYLREWLAQQTASHYLTYDSATQKFTLPPEQAMMLAIEDSPVAMMGAFDGVVAWSDAQPRVQEAFKKGGGVAWGDYGPCLFCSTARFFRPGYLHNLVQNWLPALDGVVDKLTAGAKVGDVGCGHGWSTVIMAQAFPKSQFVGYDFHPGSIDAARAHAREHDVSNATFEVGSAKDYPATGLDFVTFFDCLHDMGDPAGAAAHVKKTLKPDGTWMIVEPMAGDKMEDNMNPIGRIYYAASTLVCVPTSLSQEVGAALGAQAGEARLREVITAGGIQQHPAGDSHAVQHGIGSTLVDPRGRLQAAPDEHDIERGSCEPGARAATNLSETIGKLLANFIAASEATDCWQMNSVIKA